MLAHNSPWWVGEWGNLPHADGDDRPAYADGKPSGANASNWNPSQASKPAAETVMQAPQPIASKAPDMSAYAPPAGGFNAYSGPRTPPKGAKVNDLSGQVPSNQIWAQAYNQASNQYGGNTQAQSWTMPGSYSSQSFNPTTGQYSQPTGGQSWDGNMAYNAIDNRPGPIQATATGVGGKQMPWQDTLSQREAFAGNLVQRLNQYNGGQLTGAPTFDTQKLLEQADDQLAKGTFVNPFTSAPSRPSPVAPAPPASGPPTRKPAYAPEFQRAMSNSTQYMTGTQWQNPFGNSPQANNPMPSWEQPSYDPSVRLLHPGGGARPTATPRLGMASAVQPPSQGTPYRGKGWNDVVDLSTIQPDAESREEMLARWARMGLYT